MNILVTGAAGFIGFSLCKKFLDNTNYVIYGVDNIDNYYSVILKKKRIKELKKNKNFKFLKLDLKNKKKFKLLNKKKFKFIFHLAAQPGVRFSLSNNKVLWAPGPTTPRGASTRTGWEDRAPFASVMVARASGLAKAQARGSQSRSTCRLLLQTSS